MLANATRLCEAKFGDLFLMEGDAFRTALSMARRPPTWKNGSANPVIRPGPGTALARRGSDQAGGSYRRRQG